MRFKLFYDDHSKKISIGVLKDSSQDIILPKNVDQHLYYPIPNEMLKEVDKEIQEILQKEDIEILSKIEEDINSLIKKRKETIIFLREKYNPKIMKFCEEYKMNHPEWFI